MQSLQELLIEEIKKKGKITFARFMHMALYHPKYGYYNADREHIGRFGDYYTSPAVHKMFGEIIAKQLEEMWRIMDGGTFTVVESGANRGWLCHDIIQCIKKEYPQFYDNFYYIIVESNPYAQKKQRMLLKSLDLTGKKVSWHSYTEDGFSFDTIEGCFLSNEFVDALPVHRLIVKNKILKEIYVSYNETAFFEIEDEISTQPLRDYLVTHQPIVNEGQEYIVNLGAAEWLKHVSEKLGKGFVITIDYGDTIDGIYRQNGSNRMVRCFFKHTVNNRYYERLGEQDITTHVNFTHLINAGKSAGLEVAGFTKQSHYLIASGILERLQNIRSDMNTILKVKNLFHPEGMGEIFKVLIQYKNLENPQLTGLRPLNSVTM